MLVRIQPRPFAKHGGSSLTKFLRAVTPEEALSPDGKPDSVTGNVSFYNIWIIGEFAGGICFPP